jgi:tetraprenyl-beta-curcumene synthase
MAVTRLAVTYQVMYDYLDTLTEDPPAVASSLQLHRALTVALDPEPQQIDFYRLYDANDDGGYLHALVDTCRSTFFSLPTAGVVAPLAVRAAQRCSEAQTFTHVASTDERHIIAWATAARVAYPGYLWWELAAAGISSLAVLALLATASDTSATASECTSMDAAYFPSICALSTLFDSLIDEPDDELTGNYSYVRHYAGAPAAAPRLAAIVDEAVNRTAPLRRRRLHRTILAGVAGFYLSAPTAHTDAADPSTRRVISALSPSVIPILWTLGLRRRMKDRRRRLDRRPRLPPGSRFPGQATAPARLRRIALRRGRRSRSKPTAADDHRQRCRQ